MSILLTGGAGFIGSHTAVQLIESGYEIVIADNFCNSSPEVIDKISQITKHSPIVYPIDTCDTKAVREIFHKEKIEGVIHFAGYKAVSNSVAEPLKYYQNNLISAMTVLEVMQEFAVKQFVFSSSATVYGINEKIPYTEEMVTGATHPYGWTKCMIEQMILDTAKANPDFSPVILRYFNPAGAHESGLIGENPKGTPDNLMPVIQRVAVGEMKHLQIFGKDYDTKDGTAIRDYIHVMDLAKGHVKALQYAEQHARAEIFNLGTGKGCSVLEVVKTFENVTGIRIPYIFTERRTGDLPAYYANADKAARILGWTAEKTLEDICRDAWKWQIYHKQHLERRG